MEYIFWYKITCLTVGLAIILLGYLLFTKNIFTQSGDVNGEFKGFKLAVTKAAPGTYFVLFGSIIIGMIVFKGLSMDELLNQPKGKPKIEHNLKDGDTSKSSTSKVQDKIDHSIHH